jgi:Bacterial regulatory proteins, gntR family
VHQVDYALRLGFLRAGDQLPRIKDVTRSLAVNPDTVMKAYRELELRSIAAGRPGVGTFIMRAPEVGGLRTASASATGRAGRCGPATSPFRRVATRRRARPSCLATHLAAGRPATRCPPSTRRCRSACEFEGGGFRFTWTQSVSPLRWLLGTFGPLTLLTAVTAAICGVAAHWWFEVAQFRLNGGTTP